MDFTHDTLTEFLDLLHVCLEHVSDLEKVAESQLVIERGSVVLLPFFTAVMLEVREDGLVALDLLVDIEGNV